MSDDVDGVASHDVRGSHVQPSPVLAVALLVLFVACVALVLHSVNTLPVGGIPSTSIVHPTTTTTSTTIPKSEVIVQVANGTDRSGLARTISDQLVVDGWTPQVPIDGESAPTTVVYYRPGFKWAAKSIGKSITAPTSAVRAIGTNTPCKNSQHDDVVVLLGNNA
jgi:hypothetical protein